MTRSLSWITSKTVDFLRVFNTYRHGVKKGMTEYQNMTVVA